MIPWRHQRLSKRQRISITKWNLKIYLVKQPMEFCFSAFHNKRQKRCLKCLTIGIVVLTQVGQKLGDQIKCISFYWSTIMADAMTYKKHCHAYQVQANFMDCTIEHLYSSTITWPFETCDMDVSGPIIQPYSKNMFIKHHVMYCFVPPDRSSTIISFNLLVRHTLNSVISSESRMSLYYHITQLPMVM